MDAWFVGMMTTCVLTTITLVALDGSLAVSVFVACSVNPVTQRRGSYGLTGDEQKR